MYTTSYAKQPIRFLKSIDEKLRERIRIKIIALQPNPLLPDAKRVFGYHNILYRIRVGDYRILYEIDLKEKSIGIVVIDKRSRVYQHW
jgi:mRNA interferase RelE/StbE